MIIEKFIKLYDVIFNNEYTEKEFNEKWTIFKRISQSIDKFNLANFYDKAKLLLNNQGFDSGISGVNYISNQFPSFTQTGEITYLKYKSEQIERIIEEHKKITFENTKVIFPDFELEAIKKVLDYCKDKKIITYNGRVFVYASDEIYTIIYENIIIPLVAETTSNVNYNQITNYGVMSGVNQAFNLNITNDSDLFNLITDKLEAIKLELNNQHNDKILELENSVKKKDKKSTLTILSELASLGSFIAPYIILLAQAIK